MVSHVLSDEHATGNGNVIRKDSESASLRETALKFETSRTQRRQPQITVFVTDRAVEFVAEIVRPNAVVQSTRSFIGSRTGPDTGPVLGPDRKSVVAGKSVSVRVDIGGGRHIKN